MAQFARPDSNVTQTFFTGGFAEIDEATASDADFAYGANNEVAELEVGLTNPTDPVSSSGHIFRYRVAKTNAGTVDGGGNAVTVTVRLMQGTTQIAADTAKTVDGTWTQYAYTLSAAEADAITDYTALQLEFVTSKSSGGPAVRRGGAVSWAELEVPDALVSVSPGAIATTASAVAPSRIDQVVSPGLLSAAAAAVAPSIPAIVEPAAIGLVASDPAPSRIDQATTPGALAATATPAAPSRIDQAVTATLLAAAAAAVAPDVRFSVNPAALSVPMSVQAPARVDTEARPGLISIPATALAPAISILVNPAALSVPLSAVGPASVDTEARPGLISALASAAAFSRIDQVVAAVVLGGAASALAPAIGEEGGQTISPGVIAVPAAAVAPRLDIQVIAQVLGGAAAAVAPAIALPPQEVAPATLAALASPIAFIRVDQGVSPAAIAAAAAAIAPARADTEVIAQLIAAAVGALAPEIADTIVSGGPPPGGTAVTFVAVGMASHPTPEH